MTREKRLGRGLEALLGRIPAPAVQSGGPAPAYPPSDLPAQPGASTSGLSIYDPPEGGDSELSAAIEGPARDDPASARIAIRLIDSNPFQPRRDFDPVEMASLAESLLAHGLLQPIVVRKSGDRYQLVAGERRLRAAQRVGWEQVPIQLIEADDRRMAELAIVENLHRRDLNALDKAVSFQRYLERYQCTQEDLASRLKLDRSTIANLIRLLELPAGVQDAVRQGKISQGHARALLPLGDEREQAAFCQRIQTEGLNVRQTESLVQEAIRQADGEPLDPTHTPATKSRPARTQTEHVAALEQEFRRALGMKVALRHTSKGRGRLTIHFRNHEEFDRLRERIVDGG